MKLTQQLKQEQRTEAMITSPRIATIDAAVGRLQVQMEVVMARMDAMQGNSKGITDERNEEVSQNLLEVLRRFEEAATESNSDIQLAISSLRDIMELIPDRKPLPWESDYD
jgi:hypothetical protein